MSAHTPGPWYVDPQGWNASHSFYIRGSDKNGEQLSWGKGAVARLPRSTVMPSEANARLIAAAPDLLAALKTVIANAPEPYCAITRAIDAQCRAAIAKAEGRQ